MRCAEKLIVQRALIRRLVDMLDCIHGFMDVDGEVPPNMFDEIGCLIAEAKGEYRP